MTATVPAEPTLRARAPSRGRPLLINASTAQDSFVVHVTGELDLVTRNQLVSAATAGQHPSMTIDLGGVTFMDCSGYQALVAARRFIEGEGRQLMITGQTGQPARLLDLIAELEECPLRPALSRPASPRHLSSCRDNPVAVPVMGPHSNHAPMEVINVHHVL